MSVFTVGQKVIYQSLVGEDRQGEVVAVVEHPADWLFSGPVQPMYVVKFSPGYSVAVVADRLRGVGEADGMTALLDRVKLDLLEPEPLQPNDKVRWLALADKVLRVS